jgi:hypothetical protein
MIAIDVLLFVIALSTPSGQTEIILSDIAFGTWFRSYRFKNFLLSTETFYGITMKQFVFQVLDISWRKEIAAFTISRHRPKGRNIGKYWNAPSEHSLANSLHPFLHNVKLR